MGGDPTSGGCHGYECHADSDCSEFHACLGFRCHDPCPGSCGIGASCKVEKHHPVCYCDSGLEGDPLIRCYARDEPKKSPCWPSPCGEGTQCSVLNDRAVCSCLPDYIGDPQTGCHAECVINSDCPAQKACINKHCENPCHASTCGINAECRVYDHTANCYCRDGFMGDAFIHCLPNIPLRNNTANPCVPSPCLPGSVCHVYGNVAVCDACSNENGYNNPGCRPECLSNSDCGFSRACINQRCLDPCIGTCGQNAICSVVNHNPICSCAPGLDGNPFEHCSVPHHPIPIHPPGCDLNQCGPNAECREQNGILSCVCQRGYFGNPLIGCRPECVLNPDCPLDRSCEGQKCVNPCEHACGRGALCQVVNHAAVCFCPEDHTGDALVSCTPFIPLQPPINDLHPPLNPCDPSPCGPNGRCLISPTGHAVCSCLPSYRGNPPACTPECVSHSECPSNQACVHLKCVNPCVGGVCGIGARCEVFNHNPICSCAPGETGNPFESCHLIPRLPDDEPQPRNPCSPSPCGPFSICQVKQGHPVCSCVENYTGHPPYCRPQCVLNNDCPHDKACIRERCENPCANACGVNAECHVVSHSAFCNCLPGFAGDAFTGCAPIPAERVPFDPCFPTPCGENSICTVENGNARCSCIPPYIGDAYGAGCRPECVYNSECASSMACIRQHCRNPCPGVCGPSAECSVVNHVPVCTCPRNFEGDPFTGCRPIQRTRKYFGSDFFEFKL